MKKIVLLLLAACTGLYAQSGVDNFKGTIKNNAADSIKIEKLGGKWKTTIPVDKGGNFSTEIRQGLGQYVLRYNQERAILFLGNDSDLTVTADADNFEETLVFKGEGAEENMFMAELERGKQTVANKLEQQVNVNEVKKQAEEFFDKQYKELTGGNYNYMFKSMAGVKIQMDKNSLSAKIEQKIITKQLDGKPSPQFSYTNHKGGETSLADLKGKYVYIDIWATWCAPCRQEIPFLQEAEKMYENKNITFVSISIDEEKTREKWNTMVTEKSLGGIQLIADNAWKSDFITAYGIKSIPRFILIDPQGNIVNADAPRPSDPELKNILDKLLK